MADTIQGRVTNIVDGDTFDMRVTHHGKDNKIKYNPDERIRLAGVNAPEINTPAGKIAKQKLADKISGQEVRCTIRARDTYQRLVADFEIL